MSKVETPANVFSFKLDMIGNETGTRWRGKFTYKRPTVGMRRDISQIETILNDQYAEKYKVETPSPLVRSYNYTYAYLKVCLMECPDWFIDSDFGVNMEDENVVDYIASKIKIFENTRVSKLEEILATPRNKEEQEEGSSE